MKIEVVLRPDGNYDVKLDGVTVTDVAAHSPELALIIGTNFIASRGINGQPDATKPELERTDKVLRRNERRHNSRS